MLRSPPVEAAVRTSWLKTWPEPAAALSFHCQPAEKDVQPEAQLRQRTGHHVAVAPQGQGRPQASQPILLPTDPESPGGGQIFGQPDFWPQRKLEQGPRAAQDSLETLMGMLKARSAWGEAPSNVRKKQSEAEGGKRETGRENIHTCVHAY